jgi:hypothetical protein
MNLPNRGKRGDTMRYFEVLLLVLAILFIPMGLLYSQTGVINELGSFRNDIGHIKAFGTYEQYGYTLSYLYYGNNFALNVHDLTDNNNPLLINIIPTPLTPSGVFDCYIKIDGQRLAIACTKGIHIYSLSNPTEPVLINSRSSNGRMDAAILDGNWLFTLQDHYLKAYDISNPGPIATADSIYIAYSFSLSKVSFYMFVGCTYGPYKVLNVFNPVNLPEPLSANLDNGRLCGVWSNKAYFDNWLTVEVYDINDIINPYYIQTIASELGAPPHRVQVMDGYLLMDVVSYSGQDPMYYTEIHKISTDQPQFIASLDNQVTWGNYPDSHSRLVRHNYSNYNFLDLSLDDFMSPDILNDYSFFFNTNSETAFICLATSSRVLTIDSQDPGATPNMLNNIDIQSVAADEDLMVTSFCDWNDEDDVYYPNEITLWNIEELDNPIELSSFICAGPNSSLMQINIVENRLLMLNQLGDVIVYDISDPQSPILIGITDPSLRYCNTDLQGDRLFCLTYSSSPYSIDEYTLTSYGTMVFLGSYQHTGLARKLIAWENRLAVMGDTVWIFDATIPGAPALLSSVNTGTYLRDIVHRNNHLIILDQAGLGIYSLLPDGQTVLLATHNLSSLNYSIKLSGNIVLASSADRLTYLDCSEVFAMDNNDPQEGIVPAYSMTVYPNPSSGTTNIQIDCPGANGRTGEAQVARLDIYNLRGQKIRTLVNNEPVIGKHSFGWDGLSDSGVECSNGIYFLSLSINGKIHSTRKISLIRHGVR